MSDLTQRLRVNAGFCRSINLQRDRDSLELVQHYQTTSRSVQALEQVLDGLGEHPSARALALIGPYGAGKSAFAQFLGALLSDPSHALAQTALTRLADTTLSAKLRQRVQGSLGFLRIQINGLPDALSRQLSLALQQAAQAHALTIEALPIAADHPVPLDLLLEQLSQLQTQWAQRGGAGVLLEIDELGKFLEYEAQQLVQRDMYLLQLLAEHAAHTHACPLLLVVLLHQAFEHYSVRLGKQLREEWQKIQGRFTALPFLESAEQVLRVVAAVFTPDAELESQLDPMVAGVSQQLAAAGALPLGLEVQAARALFARCYPLHPITLLILPVLCQKVAQNERTLFSYLASVENHGLQRRLAELNPGQWVYPWELYDYFIASQGAAVSDPLTQHRWMEVLTALERFQLDPQQPQSYAALQLLKTIGLLNLIGAQRGLKASSTVLETLFAELPTLIALLQRQSLIQWRQFAQEYRVWQGSDFDLSAALRAALAQRSGVVLAKQLNQLKPLAPIVARRVSISGGTLRCYSPLFVERASWPPVTLTPSPELPLWFYLAQAQEPLDLSTAPERSVVAVCRFSERLREVVDEWMALQSLPTEHAELLNDPVAQREYRAALQAAELEALRVLRGLLDDPQNLQWFFAGQPRVVSSRQSLQQQLSRWVQDCYPHAPLIHNELINRERPSSSAATGRKRLLAAMLAAGDQLDLGISKSPAEKGLYLSLLKKSGLHRLGPDGRYGFFPPLEHDPCNLKPLWNLLNNQLSYGQQRQVSVDALYQRLREPPFGVRSGVLPVLMLAYLLAQRREVALYQEGIFCERLTLEVAELLCRRPELFTLERFALQGLQAELLQRYLSTIVGGTSTAESASLLEVATPLLRFRQSLPEYTAHCHSLSLEALQVYKALQEARSPGVLLFEALPRACGCDPQEYDVECFMSRLVHSLRELKQAYPQLLAEWQTLLGQALLAEPSSDLAALQMALVQRYQGLVRYAPERGALAAWLRRLAETPFATAEAWLESLLTLLGNAPPSKWRESQRLQAQARLTELAEQSAELLHLRSVMGDGGGNGLLLKVIDPQLGVMSRVLQLSQQQQQQAQDRAEKIAQELRELKLGDDAQWAVVAVLLQHLLREQEDVSHG